MNISPSGKMSESDQEVKVEVKVEVEPETNQPEKDWTKVVKAEYLRLRTAKRHKLADQNKVGNRYT